MNDAGTSRLIVATPLTSRISESTVSIFALKYTTPAGTHVVPENATGVVAGSANLKNPGSSAIQYPGGDDDEGDSSDPGSPKNRLRLASAPPREGYTPSFRSPNAHSSVNEVLSSFAAAFASRGPTGSRTNSDRSTAHSAGAGSPRRSVPETLPTSPSSPPTRPASALDATILEMAASSLSSSAMSTRSLKNPSTFLRPLRTAFSSFEAPAVTSPRRRDARGDGGSTRARPRVDAARRDAPGETRDPPGVVAEAKHVDAIARRSDELMS